MRATGVSATAALLLSSFVIGAAFTLPKAPKTTSMGDCVQLRLTPSSPETSYAAGESSRREALVRSASTLLTGLAGCTAFSLAANAKTATSYPQEISDKDKVVRGFKRLDYLLQNWEAETTVCGRSDNPYLGCERTPEKVMQYLGYKSMDDPLFRADKTLFRLQNLVESRDAATRAEFEDAVEKYVEKAEEGNGMAFVSSWGEANPGGGKDRVAAFIERSKADVTDCRDSLATVIRILDLKVN